MDVDSVKRFLLDFHARVLLDLKTRTTVLVDTRKIHSVIGARRVGKTYLLFSKIKQLESTGASRDQILYLNFENPVLADVTFKDFKAILELQWSLFPSAISKDMFIFIDEPQGIQDWELAVRGLQDEFNCHIFITGSSSRLSSKEIATALRGRALTTTLYPLSFKEFLSFKDIDVDVEHLDTKTAAIVQSHFNDFLRYGGYPEVALANNEQEKLKILKDYYDMTFYKDIVDRYAIKNTYLIGWLMRYIASSAAKEISLNKIFNNLKSKGMKIGKNTLYEYFSALQDAFFSHILRKFDYSFKNEEIGTPKVYLNDIGFFNLFYVEETGRRLENIVFIYLLEITGRNPLLHFHYWKSKTGLEVDFVISEGQRVKMVIQSCTALTDNITREREMNGLIACLKEFDLDEGIIVTENEERVENIQGKIIKIYPAWKWLMNEGVIN